MPLDPTMLDLDNLNPTINRPTASNKGSNFLFISIIAATAIIAAGVYFYNNNTNDVQAN